MSDEIPIKPAAPSPEPAPPGPLAPSLEESGSRALEEALKSSFFLVKIIMAGLVVVFLSSGFFQVKANEKAIILRLGKPVGEGQQALLGPGFHWAFPSPIDQVERVPITSLQTADSSIGWYQTPQERLRGDTAVPTGATLNPANSSYVLTADTNIIHVRATAQYTITDPIRFHFDFADAPAFITNALNNALLVAAGEFRVDDILTRHKTEYHEEVRRLFEDLVDAPPEPLGIHLEQMDFDESPPLYLLPPFVGVVQATQLAENELNKAEAYATNTVAQARGEASTRINAADAARSTLVKHMEAEAGAFTNYLALYERDPEFFRRLRIMQTWDMILTNAQDKLIQPAGTHQVRIQLSREPMAPPPSNP